jgi:hypothetical protein
MAIPAEIDLRDTNIDSLERVDFHELLQSLPCSLSAFIGVAFACDVDCPGPRARAEWQLAR